MSRRSDNVTKGPEKAPMRSLFYAMGYTKEELERPLIGVVSAHSEIVPGHMHLDKITEAVKAGVRMAGGTPIMVPAIGVCDGIAMGHIGMKYSLASRELIADSVETMAQAHQFDGLVLVPNCDKIVPGMVMAAARLNIPSIVISGGPMMGFALFGLDVPTTKTSSALLCMTKDEVAEYEPGPCIKCGKCSEVCPGRVLPNKLAVFAEHGDDEQFLKYNGMECCECGCCSFICPAKRPLTQMIKSMRKIQLAKRKK